MAAIAMSPGIERPRILFISADAEVLTEAQRSLVSAFQTSFINSANYYDLNLIPADGIVVDIDALTGSVDGACKLLSDIRAHQPQCVLLAITHSHNRKLLAMLERVGVEKAFVAPFDFGELRGVLSHALQMATTNRRINDRQLGDALARKSFCGLIGSSERMRNVYDAIRRVAHSDITVLIQGESGTGKELVARAIVALGPRCDQPFVSVNCSAFPESLIEAELFGHEKGAFTGADVARPGHIELADGGTLFLDEIATLGLALQTKLLRVLEDRSVTRIGGKLSKKIDFRLLVASNEDLEKMIAGGRFREDLFYRINVLPIYLPPLREREGDVPLLLDHFLQLYCGASRVTLKRIEPEALEILEDYSWPGNVRQLENLVQRLVLMVDGPLISAHHLPPQILYMSAANNEALLIPQDGVNFEQEMTRIQAAYVRAALRRANGKRAAAAAMLRISPRKMKYLCHKFDIRSDNI